MRVSDFDYELPRERIAQEPAERRDAARLFFHDAPKDASRHLFVSDLPSLLEPGDLLVATSSSGRSENILRACDAVLDASGSVVTLSGFAPDNPLRSKGRVNLYVGSDFYGYVESAHSVLGHCLTDAVADAVREGT